MTRRARTETIPRPMPTPGVYLSRSLDLTLSVTLALSTGAERSRCYQNAHRALILGQEQGFLDTGSRYVEGHVSTPRWATDCPHAWCMASGGTIIDPTLGRYILETGDAAFGRSRYAPAYAFDEEAAQWMLRSRTMLPMMVYAHASWLQRYRWHQESQA